MRRVIIPFMLAVALVAPSRAQQKKSDLEHAGLKGKVKTIKLEETKFSNKSGKPVEGKKVQIETLSYGENGMLVKSVHYSDDGRLGNYFTATIQTGTASSSLGWRAAHRASRQSSNTMLLATGLKKCRPETKGS